jgi:hypothetical protein
MEMPLRRKDEEALAATLFPRRPAGKFIVEE